MAAQPQRSLSRWENEGGSVQSDLPLVTATDVVKAGALQPLRIAPLAGPLEPDWPVAMGSEWYA